MIVTPYRSRGYTSPPLVTLATLYIPSFSPLLAGMVVTMLGLIIDGKMTRFLDPRHGDWAANNFFFFGAMALAAISLNALLASRSRAA